MMGGGTNPDRKVVVWRVLIYPAAVHRPCGHVLVKKKTGTICQITPTTTNNKPLPTTTINACTPPPPNLPPTNKHEEDGTNND